MQKEQLPMHENNRQSYKCSWQIIKAAAKLFKKQLPKQKQPLPKKYEQLLKPKKPM
jgi:hypothetical protein